jgi:hypothetical protein
MAVEAAVVVVAAAEGEVEAAAAAGAATVAVAVAEATGSEAAKARAKARARAVGMVGEPGGETCAWAWGWSSLGGVFLWLLAGLALGWWAGWCLFEPQSSRGLKASVLSARAGRSAARG